MNASGAAYEGLLRELIDAECRALDFDLVVIYGRALLDPDGIWSQSHNAIFELVGPETVDALLVLSSCLASQSGQSGLEQLFARYRSLPCCSLGVEIPGVPSIVLDNRSGMQCAVEHMIQEHGCRRLLFLAGIPNNPEAQERLDAYKSTLERHDMPFDPDLVATGRFVREGARGAVLDLLERGVPFDAVVAANDAMAVGAIEALRKVGRRVPRDVPVTGFDDTELARVGNPPLTTVRQPLKAMVRLAIRLLEQQLQGQEVPLVSRLGAEFVSRRSCGCNVRNPQRPRDESHRSSNELEYLRERVAKVRRTLVERLEVGNSDGTHAADRLIEALERELGGERDAFIGVVNDLVEEFGDDCERGRALQFAISALRAELSGAASLRLEGLWHEATTEISLANTTGQALRRLEIDGMYFRVIGTGERVSIALDLESLELALLRSLPEVGIRTAFLSLYSEQNPGQLESFLCMLDGARLPEMPPPFPAQQLFPRGIYPLESRRTSLVFPLVYEAQRLGIAVFEHTVGAMGFNMLGDQISAALHNMALHREIVQKTALHERSVQERLATLKRLQSLSVLAGGVAHDLNNALGPLVALPDVILRGLDEVGTEGPAVSELKVDLETIRIASLRASQTIKDLMTLSRQGTTTRQPFDLASVVQSCVTPERLCALGSPEQMPELILELSPQPLTLQGCEVHLARAVGNLVHNAVEASPAGGKLWVRTYRVLVIEPIIGYETIEPGDYAVVSVSDQGDGIPSKDMGRIFEPFFSNKQLSERSGTGLGLAIVHGVVKEHDGYVDVASIRGEGTTFTLYLPLTQEQVAPRPALVSIRPGSARILVVDDEPVQLRTARRVLASLGYRVDTLNSGRRACELFAQAAASGRSPCDLVILDMSFNEDQDGLEVLERIRRDFPRQKCIVASGGALTQRAETATRAGLTWLPKPYTAESLARAVQVELAREKASAVGEA